MELVMMARAASWMSGVNMYAMAVVMQTVLGWNISFSIWVGAATVALYVMLGGLRSAIINEVLQFVLIWAGAAMIPILGLIEAGGWTNLKAQIAVNVGRSDYTHLWNTLGHFKDNPMGVHWTGIVFGLGFVISFGYWTTDFLVVQRVLSVCDRLHVCFIADGTHVPFFALKNYLKVTGLERTIVVTDAIAPAGLGPGRYTLGRWDLLIEEDMVARAPDRSHFVGSAITMPQTYANLTQKLGLSEGDAMRLLRDNPRRAVGVLA